MGGGISKSINNAAGLIVQLTFVVKAAGGCGKVECLLIAKMSIQKKKIRNKVRGA